MEPGEDRLDLFGVPRQARLDGEMLVLAVAGEPFGVELGVDVVGAHEQGHDVGFTGDHVAESGRNVVRKITVHARVDELETVRFPSAFQQLDVVGAHLSLGYAVTDARHDGVHACATTVE